MSTNDPRQMAAELHRLAGQVHKIEKAIVDLYIEQAGSDNVIINGHVAGSVSDMLHVARYVLTYAANRLELAAILRDAYRMPRDALEDIVKHTVEISRELALEEYHNQGKNNGNHHKP